MFGGEQVRQLVGKVRRAVEQGQFAKPPQGPIGSLLTLADDKWALAVEMSIGKIFGSFVVHNYEDSKLLQVSCPRAHLAARATEPWQLEPALTSGLHGASTYEQCLKVCPLPAAVDQGDLHRARPESECDRL